MNSGSGSTGKKFSISSSSPNHGSLCPSSLSVKSGNLQPFHRGEVESNQSHGSDSSNESDPFSDAHAIVEGPENSSSSSDDGVTSAAGEWNPPAGTQALVKGGCSDEKEAEGNTRQNSAGQATISHASASSGGAAADPPGPPPAKHSRSKSLKENLLAKLRGSPKSKEEKKEMEEVPSFVGRNKAERVFGEKLIGYNPPERRRPNPEDDMEEDDDEEEEVQAY